MVAKVRNMPAQCTASAAEPAEPASANGLATGSRVWVIGCRESHQPTTFMAVPATQATPTTRQRCDRSRPSGSSSSGRVTPRAMPTAQKLSPARAASRAARGSGRPPSRSASTQGSKGTDTDQTSPVAAYSQPIGLVGRRSVSTRPMVANSSQKAPLAAPSTSASVVSGRVTDSVTTRPPRRQPRVASHSDQASRVRFLARMAPSGVGSRLGLVGLVGRRVDGQRYGTVTVRARPAGAAG